jgi:hypothetical protein
MSARSKEWITSLKMNGEVHALTFNIDGTRLYSHGGKKKILESFKILNNNIFFSQKMVKFMCGI